MSDWGPYVIELSSPSETWLCLGAWHSSSGENGTAYTDQGPAHATIFGPAWLFMTQVECHGVSYRRAEVFVPEDSVVTLKRTRYTL